MPLFKLHQYRNLVDADYLTSDRPVPAAFRRLFDFVGKYGKQDSLHSCVVLESS